MLFSQGGILVEQFSIIQVIEMLETIAEKLILNEKKLCQIDAQIGDGDHGTGMAIGARAIQDALQVENNFKSVGEVFQKAALVMMNSMGGASGILFSSLFLGLGKSTKGKQVMTVSDFKTGLDQAIEMIKKRGKATLGDKTMLDALIPAYQFIEENQTHDFTVIMVNLVQGAEKGVEETKKYVAKFGRAKFLGERSLGKQDAGATSIALIFTAMKEYVEEEVA